MRRQVVASADGIAPRIDKIPGLAFAQQHIFQFPVQIFFQLRGILLQIDHIQAVRIGGTFPVERQGRRLLGHGESQYHFFGHIHLFNVLLCRVQTEQGDAVAVFRIEVDTVVGSRPHRLHHVRVEGLGERFNLLALQVHQVKLDVNHTRRLPFLHVLADTSQTLRRTGQQHLTAVGREEGVGQEAVIFHQLFHLQGLHVHLVKREQGGRTLAHAVVGSHHQDIPPVGRDIRGPHVLVAEGQRLADPRLHVETRQIGTVAPSRLTVVGVDELIDFLLLFRTFLHQGKQQVVFGGRYPETTFRQVAHPHFLLSGDRVHRHQFPSGYALTYIIILSGTRHPVQRLFPRSQHLAGLQFLDLGLRGSLSAFLRHRVRSNQVFPVG